VLVVVGHSEFALVKLDQTRIPIGNVVVEHLVRDVDLESEQVVLVGLHHHFIDECSQLLVVMSVPLKAGC